MKRGRALLCPQCELVASWVAQGWPEFMRHCQERQIAMEWLPLAEAKPVVETEGAHQWLVTRGRMWPKLRKMLAFLESREPAFASAWRVQCCRLHWYAALLASISVDKSFLANSIMLRIEWERLKRCDKTPWAVDFTADPYADLVDEGIDDEVYF